MLAEQIRNFQGAMTGYKLLFALLVFAHVTIIDIFPCARGFFTVRKQFCPKQAMLFSHAT